MEQRSTDASAREVCSAWLAGFAEALENGDAPAAAAMFSEEGYWRDLLAFTWDLRTFQGRARIAAALEATAPATRASAFRLQESQAPEWAVRDGVRCAEAFILFETPLVRGRGHLRLTDGDGGRKESKAWTLLTTAQELKGFEERTGYRRPRGTEHGRGHENWLDRRLATGRFESGDPDVVIIGAGQAGLSLAARLRVLDVSALIVDRADRVGDNWRKRYHSLALHNEIWACHLPYLPFPPSWPAYIPKDMLAGWFEFYAFAMELDVWTATEVVRGSYDEHEHRWDVELRLPCGERTVRPRHLVLATGVTGAPRFPSLAGADGFEGVIAHSNTYASGPSVAGKRVLVVGSGNSGHDIAQELHGHGADVTMLQRSSTCVVSVEPSAATVFKPYHEGGPPPEDVDIVAASVPYPLLVEFHKGLTRQFAEWDKDLLEGLERVGFKLDEGDDGSGFYPKYLRSGAGYYLNVGCSELIISGEIGIKQGVGVECLANDSVVFTDGTAMPVDVVVLATGYANMQDVARRLLGDEVADRAGRAWGFDDEGELRNMWKRTGQEAFWYMGGSFAQCRNYSRYLALQIKADEERLSAGAQRLARDTTRSSPRPTSSFT